MITDILFRRLTDFSSSGFLALRDPGGSTSYKLLYDRVVHYRNILSVDYKELYTLILNGNFDLDSIAILWAALLENRIVMPVSKVPLKQSDLVDLIDADIVFNSSTSEFTLTSRSKSKKSIIQDLIKTGHPGLVLLSSGTTGHPKAILHDAEILLSKYINSRRRFNTLAVMLFDHIAGLDTLFYTLSSGGTLVVPTELNASIVIKTMNEFEVEVLPASPSFIQLLMLDSRFNKENLVSLKIITFGSERITDHLKDDLIQRFGPSFELVQKYGITEIGNPATITRKEDPRYLKFVPELVEYKIVDETLFIKSNGSLLGYLSATNCTPFDGWFNTEDKVEIDGEWIKILGRASDIINVGGRKVYPAEVESVLQSMDSVTNATVYGVKNEIMGSIVAAKVSLSTKEDLSSFKKRVRLFCKGRLESYKIPVILEIVDSIDVSDRHKKLRP